MTHILVLGAGQSSPYLIHYLLEAARKHGWSVTVADRDVKLAAQRVGGHPCGKAVAVDAGKAEETAALIGQAQLVVTLLSPMFQARIAAQCVELGANMISASYCDPAVRKLDAAARAKGLLVLCEIGLDPGIDHMSSMKVIHEIRQRGGRVTSYVSYGSGVPAPDSCSNPLRYVITWNPRNVVMASESGAQYLIDGRIKIIPYYDVFARSWPVQVEGIGTMEAYPNRDSLSYRETYGLEHTHKMIRGTLRHPGFSETWCQIVRLGLPNEKLHIPKLAERNYAELVEMFLPRTAAGATLEERVAFHLKISPTGRIMDNLRWLGLFSTEPVGPVGETMAEAMVALLSRKLALKPGERDMVVLQHELEVEYPQENGRMEKHVSTLIAYGDPGGFTAMSRTVGQPAALGAELLLTGGLKMTGVQIPTHPDIYTPILTALEKTGLTFSERVTPITSA